MARMLRNSLRSKRMSGSSILILDSLGYGQTYINEDKNIYNDENNLLTDHELISTIYTNKNIDIPQKISASLQSLAKVVPGTSGSIITHLGLIPVVKMV